MSRPILEGIEYDQDSNYTRTLTSMLYAGACCSPNALQPHIDVSKAAGLMAGCHALALPHTIC